MLLKFIDNKIRKAFSDSALQYEALAGLQREIGRELLKRVVDKEDCQSILDVGMGTGRLTNQLSLFFPEAKVVGMDFARGMIEVARQKYSTLRIVQADAAQLPFKRESFDIIISNLVYQWVDDLRRTFALNFDALKPDGAFCFTMFGERTLEELFTALDEALAVPQEKKNRIKRLPSLAQIQSALSAAGFADVALESEMIKVHFENMLALLKWLKEIGANAHHYDVYVGKDLLRRAERYYQQNFSDRWGVSASFQVIWVNAVKKAEQRQRTLSVGELSERLGYE